MLSLWLQFYFKTNRLRPAKWRDRTKFGMVLNTELWWSSSCGIRAYHLPCILVCCSSTKKLYWALVSRVCFTCRHDWTIGHMTKLPWPALLPYSKTGLTQSLNTGHMVGSFSWPAPILSHLVSINKDTPILGGIQRIVSFFPGIRTKASQILYYTIDIKFEGLWPEIN